MPVCFAVSVFFAADWYRIAPDAAPFLLCLFECLPVLCEQFWFCILRKTLVDAPKTSPDHCRAHINPIDGDTAHTAPVSVQFRAIAFRAALDDRFQPGRCSFPKFLAAFRCVVSCNPDFDFFSSPHEMDRVTIDYFYWVAWFGGRHLCK